MDVKALLLPSPAGLHRDPPTDMLRSLRILAALTVFGLFVAQIHGEDSTRASAGKLQPRSTPLSFVQNVGQDASSASYLAHGPGYAMKLFPGRVELSLLRHGKSSQRQKPGSPLSQAQASLQMEFPGADPTDELAAEQQLPGIVSYFTGSDNRQWHTDLATFGKLRYRGIYPGVDVAFHGADSSAGQKLEYDFELKPHASLDRVAIALRGAESVELDNAGNLALTVHGEKLRFLKPIAWQGAERRPVAVAYRLTPAQGKQPATVNFEVAKYDPNESLVIDPVLDYATGLNLASVNAMTADSAGNTYVVGGDPSVSFAFDVLKFNAAGTLVYTRVVAANTSGTYGYGFISGIAVSSSGDVFVTGGAAAGWPTTSGAYQATNGYDSTGYSYNAYLVELSTAGKIAYATYLGGSVAAGSSSDYATAVAVDTAGNAYLTGRVGSSNFPTTTGAYQTALPANGGTYASFVAKINPALSGTKSLVYSTLLGDSETSEYAIAADASGNAYVTGNASSNYNVFPLTSGAFAYAGLDSSDGGVYVTKFNPTGTALVYSAYLGYGTGYGIAVDGSGDAYTTGQVNTEDFPTTSGAYQTSYPGGFVSELNPAGTAEIYSTFLSGPSGVQYGNYVDPYTIALAPGCASACPAYVAGVLYEYTAEDLPQINSIQTTPSNDYYYQGFAVGLNGTGSASTFSSYVSGSGDETNTNDIPGGGQLSGTPAIGVDGTGNIYYAANLNISDFPLPGGGAASSILIKIGSAAGGVVLAYPSAVNLGTTYVNTPSTVYNANPPTFILQNMGSEAVSLTSFTASSAIFSQTNTCGGTIPGGGQCIVTPAFTPTASGSKTGTLTIASTGNGSPVVVSLSGTADDGGYLTATPTTGFNFGNVAVGATSAFQTLTVKNTGDEAITSFYLYGLPSGFNSLNNCPATLNPGVSCEFGIQFAPPGPGYVSGSFYVYSPSYGYYGAAIPIGGTGVVSGDVGSVALNATEVNFNTEAIGVGSSPQTVTITNTGTVPVTVNPFTAALTSGAGNAADFASSGYLYSCSEALPYAMTPGQSCYLYVYFTPSVAATETATLSMPTSAGTASVTLSGTGTADSQDLVFSPANYVFPDQAVGTSSSNQIFYVYNSGTVPVFFDRVFASQGDFQLYSQNCSDTTLTPPAGPGLSANYCYIYVVFSPSATGSRTGTITFIDSASGTAQILTLSGNGIAAIGTLVADPTALTFPAQALGTSSSNPQTATLTNTGNASVYVNGFSVTGDYAGTSYGDYCGSTLPCLVPPGYYFQVPITFTPTSATNPRTGTLTVNSSAGVYTVALSGTGETATQSVATTPSTTTAVSFGSIVSGSTSNYLPIYLHNTGTQPVTISSTPTVTGTSFSYYQYYGNSCGYDVTTLQPGAECSAYVLFAPTGTGTLTGTLSFTDSAGTQTLKLSGTGVSAAPTTYFNEPYYGFPLTWVGTSSNYGYSGSSGTYQYFYNETANPITIASVTITGSGAAAFPNYPFADTCTGVIVPSSSSCYVEVYFAPTAAGYFKATLTLTDTTGKAYTAPLYGYSPAVVDDGYLAPDGLAFQSQSVNTASSALSITLYNGGTTAISVGAATGTNVGPTSEFRVTTDYCSNTYQTTSCYVYVDFVPSASGKRSGTLSFPVTYSDGTTATLSASLTGTGLADTSRAVLTPLSTQFVATTIGQTSSYQTLKLSNLGTAPLIVGFLTGTDTVVGASPTGDFTTTDYCSGAYLGGGSSCTVNVYFAPLAGAAGARNGSLTFPVTYSVGTAPTSFTATYTGNAVATGNGLQVTPSSLQMGTWIEGTYSKQQTITLYNESNTTVTFGNFTSTAPFDTTWSCGATLAPATSCTVTVLYQPSAIAAQTGTINIPNNATGALQKVAVSGTGIAASQQLAFSQGTVAFGSQTEGTPGNAVTLSLVNRSSQTVTVSSANLGGTNPTDFMVVSNGCNGSTLYGYETYNGSYSSCNISLQFSPLAGTASATPLTATITEFDSGTGSGRKATLTGTSTAPAPAVGLFPATLVFAAQYQGTQSGSQVFSVSNTGSSSLKITAIATSDTTQFPIASDACKGVTLATGADCLIAVAFKPTATGTITGAITVTDTASNSPQTLPLSGTGVIPTASLSGTALTFASQGVGSTSASQSVTLSNTGTGTLLISSVVLGGTDPGDYTLTNSCGSSLAAAAHCTLSVTFTPKAAGTRTATITITDNSGLVTGATQTINLTGTGADIPQASLSATAITFASQAVGSTSASQSVTLSNGGSATLNITGIGPISGADPSDFAVVTPSGACGGSLAAGASCTINVTFSPQATGARTASVVITDNAGGVSGTTQTITLNGTGTGVPQASLSATTITFTSHAVGTTSSAHSVTLSNSGSATLSISSIGPIAGADPGDFALVTPSGACGSSLAAGASCTINVTFSPQAAGTRTATIPITDNSGGVSGTTQTINLTGTGTT